MANGWSISGVDLYLEPAAPGLGRRAWLEAALRVAVREGRLAPGTRLPPTRVLASELGIARGTVTAAYDQLAAEGFLTARRGSGTVVAELRVPDIESRSGVTAIGRLPASLAGGEPTRPVHDLMPGRPDVAAFPVAAWLRAARRVLPRVQAEVFANGDPRGLPGLRQTLAEYLGRVRGVRADPDAIVVTSGFMQGIGLLAEVLHAAGVRRIGMEEPSLPFHQEAVRRRGPEVVPLTVDELGARCEVDDPALGAVVLTPAHQAGFGVVLAPERRREFVQWARSSGGLIIEDDFDGEFRYDRQPVGALQGMAPEQVAYVGTASKTLAPGLRIGWLLPPPDLVPVVIEARFHNDVQHEVIGQLVLAELIRNLDYDRHVRAQRQRYRRRRDALLRRLARDVPEVKVWGAAAGVQLLLQLPDAGPSEDSGSSEDSGLSEAGLSEAGLSEEAVLAQARKRGLRLVALGGAWQRPGRRPMRGIVVGYGAPPEHAYSAAVDALVDTLRAALDDRSGASTTDRRTAALRR